MSVQFEEQHITPSRPRIRKASGMVGWLVQKGYAKNAAQANIFLIVFICVLLGIAFLSIPSGSVEDIPVDPEVNLDSEIDEM